MKTWVHKFYFILIFSNPHEVPAQKPQHKYGDEHQNVNAKMFYLKLHSKWAEIPGTPRQRLVSLPESLSQVCLYPHLTRCGQLATAGHSCTAAAEGRNTSTLERVPLGPLNELKAPPKPSGS